MKSNMKDSVRRLKELYILNKNLEMFYRKIREREKRLFLKSLLTRLVQEKSSFNHDIRRHLMRYTKRDPASEVKALVESRKFMPETGREKIEAVCLKMELNSYKLCQEALTKTTVGEIRATLLEHRQQMRELLENLKTMNKYVL
ncbi:hypothetical protein [Salegentibacter flavus]|nr:hypothetical protein [Salegentibacter flavus]